MESDTDTALGAVVDPFLLAVGLLRAAVVAIVLSFSDPHSLDERGAADLTGAI